MCKTKVHLRCFNIFLALFYYQCLIFVRNMLQTRSYWKKDRHRVTLRNACVYVNTSATHFYSQQIWIQYSIENEIALQAFKRDETLTWQADVSHKDHHFGKSCWRVRNVLGNEILKHASEWRPFPPDESEMTARIQSKVAAEASAEIVELEKRHCRVRVCARTTGPLHFNDRTHLTVWFCEFITESTPLTTRSTVFTFH